MLRAASYNSQHAVGGAYSFTTALSFPAHVSAAAGLELVESLAAPSLELSVPTVAAGARLALARPPGSGDALLIAQLSARARAHGQLVLVACADALDAQRLADEITFFDSQLAVRQFPDWETLPYDILSPHQDLVSDRLAALYQLLVRDVPGVLDVLVMPATTALGRLAPPGYVGGHTFFFRQGERLAADALRARLVQAGYQHVSQVVAPGEFSVRGGLIDLFPMGAVLPFRLDLNDELIESIRSFDADSQRSLYPVPEIRLLPGREFPLDEASRIAFRGRWREAFEGDPSRSSVYKDIGNGIASAGIEYYLPLFFEQTATLFDYLPASSMLVLHGSIESAAQRFWTETAERYRFLSRDTQRPCLPPERLFLRPEEFFVAAKPYARLVLGDGDAENFAALPALAVQRKAADPLERLRAFAGEFTADDGRIALLADSAGRRETIAQMLRDYGLPFADNADFAGFLASDAPITLGVAPLHGGFVLQDARLALITETELYETSPRRQRARHRERASSVEAMIRDLAELREGQPVVHVEHGIGRYLGLESMDLGDGPAEFLHLQYANDTKLYVPVAQLHLISRYSGADPDAAPLHHLGGADWDKAKMLYSLSAFQAFYRHLIRIIIAFIFSGALQCHGRIGQHYRILRPASFSF